MEKLLLRMAPLVDPVFILGFLLGVFSLLFLFMCVLLVAVYWKRGIGAAAREAGLKCVGKSVKGSYTHIN